MSANEHIEPTPLEDSRQRTVDEEDYCLWSVSGGAGITKRHG